MCGFVSHETSCVTLKYVIVCFEVFICMQTHTYSRILCIAWLELIQVAKSVSFPVSHLSHRQQPRCDTQVCLRILLYPPLHFCCYLGPPRINCLFSFLCASSSFVLYPFTHAPPPSDALAACIFLLPPSSSSSSSPLSHRSRFPSRQPQQQ